MGPPLHLGRVSLGHTLVPEAAVGAGECLVPDPKVGVWAGWAHTGSWGLPCRQRAGHWAARGGCSPVLGSRAGWWEGWGFLPAGGFAARLQGQGAVPKRGVTACKWAPGFRFPLR